MLFPQLVYKASKKTDSTLTFLECWVKLNDVNMVSWIWEKPVREQDGLHQIWCKKTLKIHDFDKF